MDDLAKLVNVLIELNTKLLAENQELKAGLAKLRPNSISTIKSPRQRQKMATRWRNIDKQIKEAKRFELVYLLRQGAKQPEPMPKKKRGGQAKLSQSTMEKLPEFIEFIKGKYGYKTDKEAIQEILKDLPNRIKHSEARRLQSKLSKIRRNIKNLTS